MNLCSIQTLIKHQSHELTRKHEPVTAHAFYRGTHYHITMLSYVVLHALVFRVALDFKGGWVENKGE
jgi:hypothetical protein